MTFSATGPVRPRLARAVIRSNGMGCVIDRQHMAMSRRALRSLRVDSIRWAQSAKHRFCLGLNRVCRPVLAPSRQRLRRVRVLRRCMPGGTLRSGCAGRMSCQHALESVSDPHAAHAPCRVDHWPSALFMAQVRAFGQSAASRTANFDVWRMVFGRRLTRAAAFSLTLRALGSLPHRTSAHEILIAV
jgi:hypothetical protein